MSPCGTPVGRGTSLLAPTRSDRVSVRVWISVTVRDRGTVRVRVRVSVRVRFRICA